MKKTIALTLTLALVLSLTACGKGTDGGSNSSADTQSENITATENPEAEISDTEDGAGESDDAAANEEPAAEVSDSEGSTDGEKKKGGGGFLVTGDVSVSAETAGKIWMDILESRGNNLCQYGNLFSTEHIMGDSAAGKFGQIESGWKADGRYDCYYTDMAEETGEVLFRYYFYPDYGAMGVEEAKAVILDCGISVGSGKISWADIKIFSMTKEEFPYHCRTFFNSALLPHILRDVKILQRYRDNFRRRHRHPDTVLPFNLPAPIHYQLVLFPLPRKPEIRLNGISLP